MTAVARAVVGDRLSEPFVGPVLVTVVIESDLRFTVSDDNQTITLGANGVPRLGFFESLIDRRRWAIAAAAAMSRHTGVEVKVGGRVWRQDLTATSVISPPRETNPAGRAGTQVTFELDLVRFVAN